MPFVAPSLEGLRVLKMKIIDSDEFQVKIFYSDEISDEEKDDFLKVQVSVFGEQKDKSAQFDRKYINNIYGPSLLALVYADNQPIAARALWRNDIQGKMAYQPCDTAVVAEWRNRGVFKLMTTHVVDFLDKKALVYNFPNDNSLPQYLKLGWKIRHRYYLNPIWNFRNYAKNISAPIDEDYVKWWLIENGSKFYSYEHHGRCYLVKKTRRFYVSVVIGQISKEVAPLFEREQGKFILYFSHCDKKSIFSPTKRPLMVAVKNEDGELTGNVPHWKMDVI